MNIERQRGRSSQGRPSFPEVQRAYNVNGQQPDFGSRQKVLVVDDNIDLTQSLVLLLEALGREVVAAYDGHGALTAAYRFLPDVVILDIGLPGMSGLDVARQLRKEYRHGELMLIALTGYGQPQDCRRSRQAGFDHHLVKPLDVRRLQSLIATSPPD